MTIDEAIIRVKELADSNNIKGTIEEEAINILITEIGKMKEFLKNLLDPSKYE